MAITNPFSITYAGQQVGGSSSTYLLHGPYVIDKSFATIRVVFDVIVTSASLQSASDTLEAAFSQRDQSFSISLSGSTWTYTFGTDVLNSSASIAKSGDPETDRGNSRSYTCVIEAELPADDQDGLRSLEVNVDYEASRRKIISMGGSYSATSTPTLASVQYLADFDAEAATILAAVGLGGTYELVDESYTHDRNNHVCNFSRQYAQLLFDQSQGQLDDPAIKDHEVTFTDVSQHPGDSKESIYRLRRVIASYTCTLDIEQATDLQSVYESSVKPILDATFQSNFSPTVFAVEENRVSYDETSKRLSATVQYIYQKSGGDDVVEVSQSVAFREARNIDYTPVHSQGEYSQYADVGWAVLERISTRTVVVLGDEEPKRRLGNPGKKKGKNPAGDFDTVNAGPNVQKAGWNIVQNTSQVSDQWIGDPDETQIKLAVLTETVVERWNELPKAVQSLTIGNQ